MDQAAGWLPDPERDGQERYWDGSQWTDHVRPAGKGVTLRLPEHVPELQRALAEATADIDNTEERLSTLFDRRRRAAETAARGRRADDEHAGEDGDEGYDVELYIDIEVDECERDVNTDAACGSGTDIVVLDEPDEASAALEVALAAEEPHDDEADRPAKRKKNLFRRRS